MLADLDLEFSENTRNLLSLSLDIIAITLNYLIEKKQKCIYNITELIQPKDLNQEDKPLRNYLAYYLAKSHGVVEKDLFDTQIIQIKRIKELVYMMKTARRYCKMF